MTIHRNVMYFLFLAVPLIWVLTSCGVQGAWIIRTDLVEIQALDEIALPPVLRNDQLSSQTSIVSVSADAPEAIEVIEKEDGQYMLRSLVDQAGEHFVTYEVSDGLRTDSGRLVIRVVLAKQAPEPVLRVSPVVLNLGVVQSGSAGTSDLKLTLDNAGGDLTNVRALATVTEGENLSVDPQHCAQLAAGDSCIVTVAWSPQTTADLSGVITILSAELGPVKVGVRGKNSIDRFKLDPAKVDFGSRTRSTARPTREVVFTNTGTTMLSPEEISAPAGVVGDFAGCKDVAPAQSCVISVSMVTSSVRKINGEFLVGADSAATQTVQVTGSVVPRKPPPPPHPPPLRPPAFQLSPNPVVLSSAAPAAFVIVTNTGQLALSNLVLAGATEQLRLDQRGCVDGLEPESKCQFVLSLSRDTLARELETTLTVTVLFGEASRELDVVVDAQGVTLFELEPASVDLLDNGLSAVVTLTNTGTATLRRIRIGELFDFGPNGDGTLIVRRTNCDRPIEPGDGCGFELFLESMPTAAPQIVEIPVTSNGVARTVVVRLSILR